MGYTEPDHAIIDSDDSNSQQRAIDMQAHYNQHELGYPDRHQRMIHEVGRRPHQNILSTTERRKMTNHYSKFNRPKTGDLTRKNMHHVHLGDERSHIFERLYKNGMEKDQKYLDY